MGHLPVIIGCKRVTFNWRNAAGQSVHNVLHFSTTEPDSEVVAAAIENRFTDNMWSDLSSEFHMFDFDVLPLDGASATHNHPVTSAHATGLGSGDYLPAYAAKVELRTGLLGRSHRGRVLVGPMPENSVTDGRIVGTGITDMQTAWTNFKDNLAGLATPINLVVASYKHASASAVTAIFTTRDPAIIRRRQRHLVS